MNLNFEKNVDIFSAIILNLKIMMSSLRLGEKKFLIIIVECMLDYLTGLVMVV